MKGKLKQILWNKSIRNSLVASFWFLIISQVAIFIWSKISNINFFQVYQKIFDFLNEKICFNTWICLLFTFVLLTLVYFYFKKYKRKERSQGSDNKILTREIKPEEKTTITDAPTVFFHNRFCDAFPGIERGYQWIIKNRDINTRLKILLLHPTSFDNKEGHGVTSDPIWWFRGSSALPVNSFKILNRSKVLMNSDELKIEKIAAYKGTSYFRDFIYVQCYPDKPIGIYKHDKNYIKKRIEENREYIENYGIYKGKIISSQELSDGAAIIKGKPQSTIGAESRNRFLTKYNFIIAAKFSPYNCDEFCRESELYFGNLLKEEISFDDFVNWMTRFEKNRNDY